MPLAPAICSPPPRPRASVAQLLASQEPGGSAWGSTTCLGPARQVQGTTRRVALSERTGTLGNQSLPGTRRGLWWLRYAVLEEMSLPVPSSYVAEILTKEVKF